MKKNLTSLIAIASIALIGCTHEDEPAVNDFNDTFTASMELSDTRTSLGDDGNTIWSDEDAVSIFKKSGYHQKYQVEEGGNDTATLKYAGACIQHGVGLSHNYAVYPYSANHTINAQGVLTLDLSFLAEQTHNEGTFENNKSVMTAKSDDNNLAFFNSLSILRVKLCSEAPGDYNINSITITSATQPLNGLATVDMSLDKQPALFSSVDVANRTTTLNCPQTVMLNAECDSASGGHDFYILMPATTFPANDLTVKIQGVDVNGENVVYEAQYPTELKLVRSGITTIHHEFTADDWMGNIEPTRIVSNADELIAALDNSQNIAVIQLAGNIDLGGEEWAPVGTAEKPFIATLDGNGYSISNLTISNTDRAAFIAYAGENVTIKNINFDDVNISSTKDAAGVVCMAEADGLTIENVKVSGTITATAYAGGIVHFADNVTIIDCENNADITANRAGGIASWIALGSNVENITNNGDITGAIGASGIAHAFAGSIKNAVNNGEITSNGTEPASGVVGIQKGGSSYEYCFNYGNVVSTADNPNASAAGILGHTPGSAATLNYCANFGNITAEQSYAAGIAYSLYGTINASYCYNNGAISGADGAGAIAPKAQFGTSDKANYSLNAGVITSSSGLTYQASNVNTFCYYYDNGDLLNVTNSVSTPADEVLGLLNSGADNSFFKLSSGIIVVNN